MQDDFKDFEWANHTDLDLVLETPEIQEDDIDPITGERKPKECEGCSA